jgi:hypothetical protein
VDLSLTYLSLSIRRSPFTSGRPCTVITTHFESKKIEKNLQHNRQQSVLIDYTLSSFTMAPTVIPPQPRQDMAKEAGSEAKARSAAMKAFQMTKEERKSRRYDCPIARRLRRDTVAT